MPGSSKVRATETPLSDRNPWTTRYVQLVRGETAGVVASSLRLGLAAASIPYRMAVAGRNLAFDRGWKPAVRAGVPVISVGNLTLGGTGKTPMVEWLARHYRGLGVRVAILSRGYGQDGGLNDEGRVLEENLPDVPHLQGPDRAALARVAVEELESQVLILDDGFQHRRLARDLDVVLIDALDPFGGGRLFPRGLLREPINALSRAGVVVLSRADQVDAPTRTAIRAEAERRAGPLAWVEVRHAPLDLIDSDGGSTPPADLAGKRVVAFCGIGNPAAFRLTLAGLGAELLAFRVFADHSPYQAQDVSDLSAWAAEHRAELALTTQKDLVKLRTPRLGSTPLRALRIGLEVIDGLGPLESALPTISHSL